MLAWCERSSAATIALARPLTRFDHTMTRCRGSRSAQHAAVEEEHDDGDLPHREHDAEIGGRAGQVEHRERERDRRHRAAEPRDRRGR